MNSHFGRAAAAAAPTWTGADATSGIASVTATPDDQPLLRQFRGTGAVSPAGAVVSQSALATAEWHANAGRTRQAVAPLESFSAATGSKLVVKDATVATALRRDAAALVTQVRART